MRTRREREEDEKWVSEMSLDRFPVLRILKTCQRHNSKRVLGERESEEEREARIQAHIKRIRADPRWEFNREFELEVSEIREIKTKYQAHWNSIDKHRRYKLQCEIARMYCTKARVIYEILKGIKYKNV